MSIFDRLHGIRKKVTAGAIAAATLIAGMGLVAPAYAADFTLVGPDTVPARINSKSRLLGCLRTSQPMTSRGRLRSGATPCSPCGR